MRQFRLSSIVALIAVIALSIWVGMLIERARTASRPAYTLTVTVPAKVSGTSNTTGGRQGAAGQAIPK
jgi:hypothetical protein